MPTDEERARAVARFNQRPFYREMGWSTPAEIGNWRRKVDDARRLGTADPAPAVDGADRIVGGQGENIPTGPRSTIQEVTYWRQLRLQSDVEVLTAQLKDTRRALSEARQVAQIQADALRQVATILGEAQMQRPEWLA